MSLNLLSSSFLIFSVKPINPDNLKIHKHHSQVATDQTDDLESFLQILIKDYEFLRLRVTKSFAMAIFVFSSSSFSFCRYYWTDC